MYDNVIPQWIAACHAAIDYITDSVGDAFTLEGERRSRVRGRTYARGESVHDYLVDELGNCVEVNTSHYTTLSMQ